MSTAVTVRKVEDKADFKAFFEFPWKLYKDDPNWVPPLLSMRRDLLDKKKNPSWQYMEGDYFAAWRNDQIVGTIAAFINHRHNDAKQEHIGWFGAFEVYEDEEAAVALLDTAANWVQERGYDAIRGPQTFTVHEDVGLLVEGFTRPVLLMPYHKPYFQRLVEAAGFTKKMDVYSFYSDHEMVRQQGTLQRLDRISQRLMQRGNITVRPINRRNLKAEFELFKEIYNTAWEDNWGFVPMTPQELDVLVASLGQFFEPNLAFFADIDGDPAGFIMGIPDLNQVLHKVYPRPGVPEVLSLLKAAWHWKIRRVIDWVRIPLMGVKPKYRNRGVDGILYYFILKALIADPRYHHGDSGWILESNHDMVSIANSHGTKKYKTHRFYEKAL